MTMERKLKGSEPTIMMPFWILFALAAAAIFFIIAQFVFVKLMGIKVY
jgi:hypothetical protein